MKRKFNIITSKKDLYEKKCLDKKRKENLKILFYYLRLSFYLFLLIIFFLKIIWSTNESIPIGEDNMYEDNNIHAKREINDNSLNFCSSIFNKSKIYSNYKFERYLNEEVPATQFKWILNLSNISGDYIYNRSYPIDSLSVFLRKIFFMRQAELVFEMNDKSNYFTTYVPYDFALKNNWDNLNIRQDYIVNGIITWVSLVNGSCHSYFKMTSIEVKK